MSEPTRRRRACVLLPLFSIRNGASWGLGEIPDLPGLARWSSQAGFSVVQLLPVNEVRGGETSPYSAASAFALDPVYLSLEACEDFRLASGQKALSAPDRATLEEVTEAKTVAWGRIRALKDRAAGLAFARFVREEWATGSARAKELLRFREREAAWLEDYALYAVLHDRFQKGWGDWPASLRDRVPTAIAAAREEHRQVILFKVWLQWQLDTQWRSARADAQALGVELMGDLPFVVSGDSADVWAHRQIFRTDLRAGTPPDPFSAEGQDWGLPVYDWQAMERSGFAWMRKRAGRAGALFAFYRVDHVIGLYRTFYRSADGKESGFTPENEADQIRLGETLLRILSEPGQVVAEDLGMVPEFLRPSITRLGIPGYRVLRWEKEDDRTYRDPATWPVLSVATSGTHDIETNAEWYDDLPEEERKALCAVPGLEHLAAHVTFNDAVRDALLRVIYAAPSELVAVPFQDALGTRERVNVPGTVTDANWTYRMSPDLSNLVQDSASTERLRRLAASTLRTV